MSTGAAATRDKNKAKTAMREEIMDFIMSGKATNGGLMEDCKCCKNCGW